MNTKIIAITAVVVIVIIIVACYLCDQSRNILNPNDRISIKNTIQINAPDDKKTSVSTESEIHTFSLNLSNGCNSIYAQLAADDEFFDVDGEISGKQMYEGDIIASADEVSKFHNSIVLWPNRTIPYNVVVGCFNYTYVQAIIYRAIEELETNTCLRFQPVATEDIFLSIDCDMGCSSQIGYGAQGGLIVEKRGRYMSIDPKQCRYGNVLHEFLHAIGLQHMHNAHNRDDYIQICHENVKEFDQKQTFFQKMAVSDVNSYDTFDFGSIMMLPLNAFAKTNNMYTMLPLKTNVREAIGQRKGLSKKDIVFLNKLYDCKN